jgi:hypothetical protein
MARYSGRNLYLSYDGTVIDTVRSVTWSDEADDIDATAAGDTRKFFLAGLIEGTLDVEALDDDTTSNVFDALVPQNEGTAIWGPDGTASGNKRFTSAAVVTSREQEAPYDDVVTIASTVRLNELPVADTWP